MSASQSWFASLKRKARSFGRVLRRVALVACLLLFAVVLTHNWLAGRRWTAYRQAAEARGVVLEVPKKPVNPIPDSENFAAPGSPFAYHPSQTDTWLQDFTGIHMMGPQFGIGERMTTEKAYAKNRSPIHHKKGVQPVSNVEPADQNPEGPRTAEDFLAICEHNFGKQWPAILEAEARPKTQPEPSPSPFIYKRPFSALEARKTAQLHDMRAMAFLDLGRREEALREVQNTFRLVRAIQRTPNPDLIATMIATAIQALDLSAVWEGLVDRKWTDEDLVALQSDLASLHPEALWAPMVDAERTRQNEIFDALASEPFWKRSSDLHNLFVDQNEQLRETNANRLFWPVSGALCTAGLVRDSQYAADTFWDAARKRITADGQWHPAIPTMVEDLIEKGRLERFRYILAFMVVPSVDRASLRMAVTVACVRDASVAVALERYRRQHQTLPETLDPLVPEFISAIPANPFNGHPIAYERENAESFRLLCAADNDNCKIYDVWPTEPKESNVVTWYGLAPEPSEGSKTAAR